MQRCIEASLVHMTRRSRLATPRSDTDPFLIQIEEQHAGHRSWFVYLFALSDCSTFKVGFSCNPLQRICTFSRRYFERFDLTQSVVLDVQRCESARALETALKTELASHRAEAPAWIPSQAGGHTEWFSAVYLDDAMTRLHSTGVPIGAFDLFLHELTQARSSFESWARSEAFRVSEDREFANRGYIVRDRRAGLRDWLDAYRYFDLPLFADEPEVLAFVRQSCAGA